MKRVMLSTELLNHIMCVGMYDTVFSGHDIEKYVQEDYLEDHPDFDGEIPTVYDYELNEFIIIDALGDVISDEVLPFLKYYGVSDIVIGGWYHPRYYNFETDSLDLSFDLEDDFFTKAADKIKSWKGNAMINEYIADHFRTRDGFWSFSPESRVELLENMTSRNPSVQAIGEYITLLLVENFGTEYLQEVLEYNYYDDDRRYNLFEVDEKEMAA